MRLSIEQRSWGKLSLKYKIGYLLDRIKIEAEKKVN